MRAVASTLLGLTLAIGGCESRSADTPDPGSTEDVVRATTAPVGWMARTIAGDLVPVEMLCPDGQWPAAWRPGPDVVGLYQQAKVIATNGAEFEAWVRTAPLPQSRVVASADAIEGGFIRVLGETHSHGPQGEHAHERTDGHTWIDPINAVAQAGAIQRAMSAAFPEFAESFTANLAALDAEMQSLHERLEGVDTASVRVIAPDSPFGYIARRYDWFAMPLDGDPKAWSDALDEVDLETLMTDRTHAIVLCETAPDADTAAALLSEHSVRAVVWNTGELTGDADYAQILSQNIDHLEEAIRASMP